MCYNKGVLERDNKLGWRPTPIVADCHRKEVIMTNRITKAQRFEDIKAMLNGENVQRTSVADAVEFIDKELELLAKKNSAKSGKMTATQKANEGYREMILDFLATVSEGVTCTEIAKGVPALNDFNNQKVSALMRGLTYDEEKNPEGKVVKTTVKGKSLFALR